MVFLITGGAGFIGSAVIRFLISKTNHVVINVDKLTYAGNLDSLLPVSQSNRYFFEMIDICDKDSLNSVFQKYQPNIVMHLAAESHVDRSIDGPSEFINTNIIGTFTLLEASLNYFKYKPSNHHFKFHHISTDEVYGDLPHPDDTGQDVLPLFQENSSYQPSSPYSATKAASDHLVRAWARTYGLPTFITNCSNNYGPYHFPEKLIPLTILNALSRKPIQVYGDGSQIRDWLYVDDHAEALVTVALNASVGDTFNIGGHNELRNIDVVKTICRLMDSIIPNEIGNYENLITYVEDRPGHDRRYAIDASKISQAFNWQPKETFESGILKTIKWYLNNEEWWQRIHDRQDPSKRLGIAPKNNNSN